MREGGWSGWLAAALAAAAAVLVIIDFTLAQANRSLQVEVNKRQQFINESIQLERVNGALVHAIASAAVNAKDDRLRDVLTRNGITINVNPAANGRAGDPARRAQER